MSGLIRLVLSGRDAIQSAFAPWTSVPELRAENARLRAKIARLLAGGEPGSEAVGIDANGMASPVLAGIFMGLFHRRPDLANYIECTFSSAEGPVRATVCKSGERSPLELLQEATRERDSLRFALAAAQNELRQFLGSPTAEMPQAVAALPDAGCLRGPERPATATISLEAAATASSIPPASPAEHPVAPLEASEASAPAPIASASAPGAIGAFPSHLLRAPTQ